MQIVVFQEFLIIPIIGLWRKFATYVFQCINSFSYPSVPIATNVFGFHEICSSFPLWSCLSGYLVNSKCPEIWWEAAKSHSSSQDVFWAVGVASFAISDVNASMRVVCCTSTSCAVSIFALLLSVALPLPTGVVGVVCVWRGADILLLPNVGLSAEQIGTALGVVKVVKGQLKSGHWRGEKSWYGRKSHVYCWSTCAANILTAGCVGSPTFLHLLAAIFTAACDLCRLIIFVQPHQGSFHLLTKNSEHIKHKLVAVSCVEKVNREWGILHR